MTIANKFKKRNIRIVIIMIAIIVCFLASLVGITLAFFTSSDYGSNYIGMSGKVQIVAVGEGDISIEDNDSCNLEVSLDSNYSSLIPGMPISLPANCKVLQSTTSPLLRARFQVVLTKSKTDATEMEDTIGLVQNMSGQLMSIIDNNGWELHSDGYLYYVGRTPTYTQDGELLLKAVNVSARDEIIDFINSGITFPTFVDQTYSGLGVKFKITFQAIQDYIPNDKGERMDNTIPNSLKIFGMCGIGDVVEVQPSGYTYTTLSNGTAKLTLKSDVAYPETLMLPTETPEGIPITTISASFASNKTIKNLIVPSSYTSIEPNAFQGNTTIQNVNLSMCKITQIPDNCFYNSSIEEVYLPEGLTTIGSYAFRDTPLSSINIPSTVKTIGYRALLNTHLVSIYIPASVTSISEGAISSPILQKIEIDEENPKYYDVSDREVIGKDGKLIYVAAQYEDSTLVLTEGAVFNRALRTFDTTNNTKFSSPTGIELIQVSNGTMIWLVQFAKLQTYTIPDSVVKINDRTIVQTEIQNLIIGENLQDLGQSLYIIHSFQLDADNQYLYTTTGNDIVGRDGILYKHTDVIVNSYTVPNAVHTIARGCFYMDTIKSLTLPSTLTTLVSYSVTHIKGLTSLTIPSSVTTMETISLSSLYDLQELIIEGGPTSLVSQTIYSNSKLTKITFKYNISSALEANCVSDNPSLKTLVFSQTTPPSSVSSSWLSSCGSNYKIYVPDSAVSTYKSKMSSYSSKINAVSVLS